MSPDEPSERERHDTALQEIIDSLAASGHGRSPDDLVRDLTERLHQQGLPAMPATWVRAVATEAAVGNPYVVSRFTAENVTIPQPETPDQPYGIS